MIRKKLSLLIISLCAMLLVGCGKVIDLTDEETQLIAEYAAELLLKYDSNYLDRMKEGNTVVEDSSTESLENLENVESTTEQVSSEDTNQGESTEDETLKEESTSEETMEENSTTEDSAEEETAPVIGTEQNIAAIAGIEGVDITFRDYSIVDMYPATDEQGEFIYLEASEGYQLLVLQFDVVNTTSGIISFSMLDHNLDYRVVCNGTKAANPMLTILMDDLGTLETNVEPGVPQEAVLIFQISDGMQHNIKTMDLYVTYNEMDNLIQILQ